MFPGMNLFLTLIIWFRTFFLLPIGWVRGGMNVYQSSPVYCKLKIFRNRRSQSVVHQGELDVERVGTFRQAGIRDLKATFCCLNFQIIVILQNRKIFTKKFI